jgi:O-antigen/teichoic acid export membrane protein
MSEIVDESLRKITKGAILVLVGTTVGILLGMVSRIIVARYLTQGEYGIYSLALVILNVVIVLSAGGLQVASPRQIAFYRGKNDALKVRGIVVSSLQIAVILGVFFSLVLFFASDLISTRLFHSPELSTPLRVFCIAIPFFVLIHIFTAIFRGFDRAEPGVYFRDISRNVLFTLLLVAVVLLGLPFMGVVYTFVASILLTCIAFAIYAIRKPPLTLKDEGSVSIVDPVGKELLLFSLPLFAAAMLANATTWIDTLMLGYFMVPDDVGLYNAALPLIQFLSVVSAAFTFLYVPLMSKLYAKDQMDEIKRSYAIVTKWIFVATLPVFLIFVLFPEATLNILFGSRYIDAAFALQILSVGFFLLAAFGPTGNTLIALGKIRFIMWSTLAAMIINIILNIVLIPPLGIVGAAIATASSVVFLTFSWAARLYSLYKMHPFTKNYLKPAIASVVLVFIIYAIVKNLVSVIPFWLLPLLLILFLGAYTLSVLLTRSFDKEDIMILLTLEARLGINLTPIKRILKRFL